MALAQYSELYWVPSGAVAAGVSARVFNHSTNTLAALWADAAGTVPLANPLTTSATGRLEFYAEEGAYWVHIDSEAFEIAVGAAAQPATQQDIADAIEPIGLDTGVIFGGELNANLANPLALDIGATVGFIVDYVTTPATPVVTRVEIPAQTVALTDTTRVLTWWMADSAGAIIQQGTRPTNTQRRTHLQLGATAQAGGAIFIDQTLPVILPQPTNQLYDLLYALGSFNIEGNAITPVGANLEVAKSAGTVFATGFNHFAGPVLTNDPHVSSTPAQNPTSLRYTTRTPSPAAPTVTNVDVANYDNAGVITPIGGGANRSTIQRVYLFPVNAPADQIVVQYGQTIYNSLSEAVSAIASDPFVQNPTLADGLLLGFIVATRSATNLSDATQARIVMAAKFGSGPAGSSSGLFALLSGAAFTGAVSVNDANLSVIDTGIKGYRFRQDGSDLDLEATGAGLFLSVWSGANFDGTQRHYLRLESGAHISHASGVWQFSSGPFAAAVHTVDGLNNLLGFHGEAPVARQSVTGSRGGNAALASLLTALDTLGLITDNTTA